MRVYINNGYKQSSINFPCTEKEIAKCYEDLDLENSTKSKITIGEVYINDDLSEIMMDKETTLDELNFFMKYFDSLSQNEIKTFYTVADAKKLDNMKDLINLTQNTNCYSLVDDFSNLNELGKNLYINEEGGVPTSVLREFDGKSYVENMIRNNPTPLVSKHGLIYPNSNEEQNIYNGKNFPAFWYKPCPITMCLDIGTDGVNLFELNFLARKLEDLEEIEMFGFDGMVEHLEEKQDLQSLINIAMNCKDMQGVDISPATTDEELGEFYIDVGIIEEVNKIPYEFREWVIEHLDAQKVGEDIRDMENGFFTENAYISLNNDELLDLYDGVIRMPEQEQIQESQSYTPPSQGMKMKF